MNQLGKSSEELTGNELVPLDVNWRVLWEVNSEVSSVIRTTTPIPHPRGWFNETI